MGNKLLLLLGFLMLISFSNEEIKHKWEFHTPSAGAAYGYLLNSDTGELFYVNKDKKLKVNEK